MQMMGASLKATMESWASCWGPTLGGDPTQATESRHDENGAHTS